MAVKIVVGLSDEQMLAQLAKQKASHGRKTKTRLTTSARLLQKLRSKRCGYGKSLVKQNRDAEQALKDRVAAVEAAAKKGEITEQERKRTVGELLRKHREAGEAAQEAARKGTDAYKKEAAADRSRQAENQRANPVDQVA